MYVGKQSYGMEATQRYLLVSSYKLTFVAVSSGEL
jgi:hypothetical protein